MIEALNLEKNYGSTRAVDGISFNVGKGEILGFLGPNGAGKSTTMKMLTCFLPPTGGTAKIGGKDIIDDSLEVRKMVGYLPESAPSYRDMTVEEFLSFIAEIRGFSGSEKKRRAESGIAATFLESVRKQTIDTLSKGFRQRVGFAQALVHDPPVLILDEPTDGLDPNQKHEVRNLIRNLSREKAIILSTHILEEMEAVCTRAVIIDKGKIVADGTPDQLLEKSSFHNLITLRFSESPEGLEKLEALEDVSRIELIDSIEHCYRVVPKERQNILGSVSRLINAENWTVAQIQLEKGKMDEVFRNITTGSAL